MYVSMKYFVIFKQLTAKEQTKNLKQKCSLLFCMTPHKGTSLSAIDLIFVKLKSLTAIQDGVNFLDISTMKNSSWSAVVNN